MDKKNKRPVYELFIDGDVFEVDRISIVSEPAVERNFLAFNKADDTPKQLFNLQEDDYMEVLGVAMVCDTLIPRVHPFTKEVYDVYFSKETIRKISQNFFYKGYQHSVNLQHMDIPVNAVVFQSYIVNTELDMNTPKGIQPVPDGSWIVGMKLSIDDQADAKIWDSIKNKKVFQGFSIEGYFIDQLTKNFSIEELSSQDELTKLLLSIDAELDAYLLSLKR